MSESPQTAPFSLKKRVHSFAHAGRGLKLFITSTHNARIHLAIFVLVVIAGFYFHISESEWFALIIVSGMVFTAESFNTAIEIDMNLTSPDFHPYARDAKDVAAGAVLISSLTAVGIGLIIFLPHVVQLFS